MGIRIAVAHATDRPEAKKELAGQCHCSIFQIYGSITMRACVCEPQSINRSLAVEVRSVAKT